MADIAATVVIPNARLELLRAFAWCRETFNQPGDPRHFPLDAGDWKNTPEDIWLAARECAAIGEIELAEVPVVGAMVGITDKGYAAIRVHDAVGESAQEARAHA